MESIEIYGGFLVRSIDRSTEWFYFDKTGVEIQILVELIEKGSELIEKGSELIEKEVKLSCSRPIMMSVKNRIKSVILEDEHFKSYKAQWEEVQDRRSDFYRSETNRHRLLRKINGDRPDIRDTEEQGLEVA